MINWNPIKVLVKDLIPYEANPRKITAKDFDRLVNDIKVNGYHKRILATKDLRIIGGHQRKKALETLGITKIEVLVPDQDISDEKFRELVVKDNVDYGEFDAPALYKFADIDDLGEWGVDLEVIKFVLEPIVFQPNYTPSPEGNTKNSHADVHEVSQNLTSQKPKVNIICPHCYEEIELSE